LQDLIKIKQWWKGPKFLFKPATSWPPEFKTPLESTDEVQNELKKLFCGDINKIDFKQTDLQSEVLNPERYSVGKLYNGFRKLINITMKVFAFLKAKDKLTHKECEEKAKTYLVLQAQQEEPFVQNVIDQLTNNEVLLEFGSLKPFVDENGILRSDSRLRNTKHIAYCIKCPMILTKQMYLAKLIVQSYHHNFKHPIGRNLVKHKVREDDYFILGLDKLFQTVKSECTICKYR
jgi:hypothetical protein